jgi:antitoxin component of RelBE/YafQ-DinJ toxin-antitoxin module
MLKRSNVFLDTKILKELEAIGKSLGLKTAQVIRMALAEFVKARKKGDQQ